MAAFVLFAFIALMASYQHPASFLIWDAFMALITFFLVRQLAVVPEVADGLMLVLLASTATSAVLSLARPVGIDVPMLAETPPHLLPLIVLCLPLVFVLSSYGWRAGGWNRLIPVSAIVLIVAGGFAVKPLLDTAGERYVGYRAGLGLAQEYPLLGGGPGSFVGAGLPHVPSDAVVPLTASHSAWMELIGAAGIPFTLLIVITLAMFVRQVRKPEPANDETSESDVRWDLYIGGMVGLLLAFGLIQTDLPRQLGVQSLFDGAIIAGVRALIWFASLALFEGLILRSRAITQSLMIGVIGVAILGSVTEAVMWPAVLQPVMVFVALALNRSQPVPKSERKLDAIPSWWLAPTSLMLVTWFGIQALFPATQTADAIHRVRAVLPRANEDRSWVTKVRAIDRPQIAEQAEAIWVAGIVRPLARAATWDPNNVALILELLRATEVQWELNIAAASVAVPGAEKAIKKALDDATKLAPFLEELANRVIRLDPQSVEGYLAGYNAMLTFARQSKLNRAERLAKAEEWFRAILARDPRREVELRYRMVETRFAVNDQQQEAVQLSIALLKLDRRTTDERYRLTEPQRTQVLKWLNDPIPAVLEELLRE